MSSGKLPAAKAMAKTVFSFLLDPSSVVVVSTLGHEGIDWLSSALSNQDTISKDEIVDLISNTISAYFDANELGNDDSMSTYLAPSIRDAFRDHWPSKQVICELNLEPRLVSEYIIERSEHFFLGYGKSERDAASIIVTEICRAILEDKRTHALIQREALSSVLVILKDHTARLSTQSEAIRELLRHTEAISANALIANPVRFLEQLNKYYEHLHNDEIEKVLFGSSTSLEYLVQVAQEIRKDNLPLSADVKSRFLKTLAIYLAHNEGRSNEARDLIQEIKKLDRNTDGREIEARILATNGSLDEALQMVGNANSPSCRTMTLSIFLQAARREDARKWFNNLGASEPSFLTAPGWRNIAWIMCDSEDAESFAGILKNAVDSGMKHHSFLYHVEGMYRLSLCLPLTERIDFISDNTIFHPVLFSDNAKLVEHQSRILECFRRAEARSIELGLDEFSRHLAPWICLVLLSLRETRSEGKAALEVALSKQHADPTLIALADFFNVKVDVRGLEGQVEAQLLVGSLDRWGRFMKLNILKFKDEGDALHQFITSNKDTLIEDGVSEESLASLVFDTYVDASEYDKAEDCLSSLDETRFGNLKYRMTAQLSRARGNDPCEILRDAYVKSSDVVDLINLCRALDDAGRFSDLVEFSNELFEYSQTIENATRLVKSLVNTRNSQRALEVISRLHDSLADSPALQFYKAVAELNLGEVFSARSIAQRLYDQSKNHDAAWLLVQAHLLCGDWENISYVVQQELNNPGQTAFNLFRLAQIVAPLNDGVCKSTINACMALAPNEPGLVAGVIKLAFEVGMDKEAGVWLETISNTESHASNYLVRREISDVAELFSSAKKSAGKVEVLFRDGEIPIHLYCEFNRAPISAILSGSVIRNISEPDFSRKSIVPIYHGKRISNNTAIKKGANVYADITALLLSEQLDILEAVERYFDTIFLAWPTMSQLHQELMTARHHQPSQVSAAKSIMKLVSSGRLRSMSRVQETSLVLASNVGSDIAELLESAKSLGGKLIIHTPITVPGSLGQRVSDVSSYEEVIASVDEIASLADLKSGNKLFVEEAALTQLNSRGLLDEICYKFEVFTHESAINRIRRTLDFYQNSESVQATIHRLRRRLSTGLLGAKYKLDKSYLIDDKLSDSSTAGLAAIQLSEQAFEFAWIEDRMSGSKLVFQRDHGPPVPIINVIDIIRSMESSGDIARVRRYQLHDEMRNSNISFIPFERDEVKFLLESSLDSLESPELSNFRRNIQASMSQKLMNPSTEFIYAIIARNLGIELISEVWRTASLQNHEMSWRSDWLLEALVKPFIYPDHILPAMAPVDELRAKLASEIAHLWLMSLVIDDNQSEFRDWIIGRLIEPYCKIDRTLSNLVADRLAHVLMEGEPSRGTV